MAWRNAFGCCSFGSLFQGREGEAQLGCTHTIKSHGAMVAKRHKHDWLILLLLIALEIILNVTHPFYRFVGKDMMTDLKYPLKDNTVPIWAVPLYAMLLPIAIFLVIYLRRRDVYDLHNSVLGLLFSVLITGVITDAIKNATGRPRPDFFWRCFPDGVDKYDRWGNVVCHGDPGDIREGHKSFPSGHTSWSFAGLGFLSLYLAGKIKAFDRKGHVAKLCIVFLPLLIAALVAVSRVDDYWHHWQDVFAGGLIGLVVATFCYLQFFPPPYHVEAVSYAKKRTVFLLLFGNPKDPSWITYEHYVSLLGLHGYMLMTGWGPYAYFRAVEESSRTNPSPAPPNNEFNMQNTELQVVDRQSLLSENLSKEQEPNFHSIDLEQGRK